MSATDTLQSPSERRTAAPLTALERAEKEGGVVTVRTQPIPASVQSLPSPELRVIEEKRRAAKLHLLTYMVGSAVFWTLWAAVSVSADRWYGWVVAPLAGWTLVLALHLWDAYR